MDNDVIIIKGKESVFKIFKSNIAFQETSDNKDWVNFYMNSGDSIHCKVNDNGELVFDRIFKA